jgi:hypothetical protein
MQSNAGTKGNSPSASDGEFPQVELKKNTLVKLQKVLS